MGTICLSLAPILRCQTLTRTENAVLFVPAALEIVFSATLLIARRGSRKHLILAGEGVTYTLLAALDLLTHLLPAARTELSVFKSLDVTVGTLSFLPLMLFTSFLYFFTTREILSSFPYRVQNISKYTLAIFIPLIVVVNELESFLMITYRILGYLGGQPFLIVGFTNKTVRGFLNGLVLALFVSFQALSFSAVFLRLVKAFLNQRRIESAPDGTEKEVHLFNGTGWIAVGIKLGAIEGLIGFAGGGFGEALTRRIFRFLGRACLIIGVLKGVDTVEDFAIFSFRQAQTKRRSALRALISNPRNSTFHQIDGYDYYPGAVVPSVMANTNTVPVTVAMMGGGSIGGSSFSNSTNPRQVLREIGRDEKSGKFMIPEPIIASPSPFLSPSPSLAPSSLSPSSPSPPRAALSVSPSRPFVTVRQGRNRAPTLELTRLSNFSIPLKDPSDSSPRFTSTAATHGFPERGRSYSTPNLSIPSHPYAANSNLAAVTVTLPEAAINARPATVHTMAIDSLGVNTVTRADYSGHITRRSNTSLPGTVRQSVYSTTSDSLEVVRALTSQFPGIPPRITPKHRQPAVEDSLKFMQEERETFPVVGVKRTPSDRLREVLEGPGLVRRGSSLKRKPVPIDSSETDSSYSSPVSRGTDGYLSPGGASRQFLPTTLEEPETPIRTPRFPAPARPVSQIAVHSRLRRFTAPDIRDVNYRQTSYDAYPPLPHHSHSHPSSMLTESGVRYVRQGGDEDAGAVEFKAIGGAPMRRTPSPMHTLTRESVVAEWFNVAQEGHTIKVKQSQFYD